MDEFFARQAALLRLFIRNYRGGNLNLNSLIQRIEGIGEVLSSEAWKEAVFPIVLSMEQVNASSQDASTGLTEADKAVVESSLRELEGAIGRFEST